MLPCMSGLTLVRTSLALPRMGRGCSVHTATSFAAAVCLQAPAECCPLLWCAPLDTVHVPPASAAQVKGNVFKNKRVLMEAVHRQKAEKVREKAIADQFEARRAKNKSMRERKAQRREERIASGLHLEPQAATQPAAPATKPAKK